MKHERAGVNCFIIALATVSALTVSPAAAAQAPSQQELPRSITLATIAPGTLNHAIATGLGKIFIDETSIRVIVRSFSGVSGYVSDLASGAIALGMFADPNSGKKGPYEPNPNLRLIASRVFESAGGIVVRKDSGITSLAELKGKRLGVVPGHPVITPFMRAILATAGVDMNRDVSLVSLAGVAEGPTAVMEGRADAGFSTVGMGPLREADAKVGMRFLPLVTGADAEEKMDRYERGGYIAVQKAGQAGVTEDMPLFWWPQPMATSTATSDKLVRTILEVMWNNQEKIRKIHPNARLFDRTRMATLSASIPFHEAAVQFYKDKGIWTDELEQRQQQLLKQPIRGR
jgi:TRAP transporter TAXI family solute receptor